MGFSLETEPETGAFVRNGALVLRIHQDEEVLMQAEQLALRGRHNLYNSLAAAIAARVMEVRSNVVRESLASFEGVPHRLEFVREIDHVRYVNDSKATNVNAVWYALESFDEPILLLAGGRDKGNDYTPLKPLVRQKVRAVIALGESAEKVMQELGTQAEHSLRAQTMEEAVKMAHMLALPGDVVLLSPACASFDMFQNYEDRGDTFKRLVENLL
jgi:UDP-N-acetylmuramoylalanine--D-glutamate ligase